MNRKSLCILYFLLSFLLLFSFTENVFAQANQWVWQSGDTVSNSDGSEYTGNANVPSEVNFPAARANASISADNSGNLWLFGGGIIFNDFGKL